MVGNKVQHPHNYPYLCRSNLFEREQRRFVRY